jgi:hypothetical protein
MGTKLRTTAFHLMPAGPYNNANFPSATYIFADHRE